MLTTLGIDVGTTNTKVALVDVGGPRVLAIVAAPTPAPADLAGVLAGLVATVLRTPAAVAAGRAPVAVGVASMAETGVPLAADGRPRGDWLRWDGHRAGAEAEALAVRLGRAELFAATGVRASAKIPLATWEWLRTHDPDALHAGTGRWAGAADLVGLLLTGRLATDHTLAGRTGAYRLGSPGTLPGGFDADLLAEVGLRAAHVPEVLAPGEILGAVAEGPFTAAGLPAGTPVTVAGHDHPVGTWAAGVRAPGQAADSVGTAEAVCTVLAADPEPGPVAAAGMSLVRTVTGAHPALLAGSSSAGGAVAWWHAAHAPDVDVDAVMTEVDALGDAPLDAFVLPYVHGRQTPAPDPAATARLPPELRDRTATGQAFALLTGLALQARWMLDEQGRLAGGLAASSLTVLGGPMSSNPAWRRLKARVTPTPVLLVAEPEPVAAGAALLAAERVGAVDIAPALPSTPLPSSRRPGDDDALSRFVTAATAPA